MRVASIQQRLISIVPTKSTVCAGLRSKKPNAESAKESGQEAMSFGIGPV
jgi:hypothetical protein